MNWKWLPNWLKTNKQLIIENNRLREAITKALDAASSINNSLNFNIIEHNNVMQTLRNQTILLLGGVALQHQGELLIKDEFTSMITNPEYHLELVIERNKENNGTYIKAVELPKEDKNVESAE